MLTLPPGPWEYETTAPLDEHHGKGHVYIVDSTGKRLMSLWGSPDQKMALADLVIRARAGLLPLQPAVSNEHLPMGSI